MIKHMVAWVADVKTVQLRRASRFVNMWIHRALLNEMVDLQERTATCSVTTTYLPALYCFTMSPGE